MEGDREGREEEGKEEIEGEGGGEGAEGDYSPAFMLFF